MDWLSCSYWGAGDRGALSGPGVPGALSGPGVPGRVPAITPVDQTVCPTRSQAEGGAINSQVFVTTGGDRITRPHGCRPQLSRIGVGPYPQLYEVSKRIEIGFI